MSTNTHLWLTQRDWPNFLTPAFDWLFCHMTSSVEADPKAPPSAWTRAVPKQVDWLAPVEASPSRETLVLWANLESWPNLPPLRIEVLEPTLKIEIKNEQDHYKSLTDDRLQRSVQARFVMNFSNCLGIEKNRNLSIFHELCYIEF